MNFEIIASIFVLAPLLWIVIFQQEKLKDNKVFLKCLLISIFVMGFGFTYEYQWNSMGKSAVYFFSQMAFIFVVLYKIVSIPYYLIFKHELEISEVPEKWIDIIPTLIVTMGTIILPFLFDSIVVQQIIE